MEKNVLNLQLRKAVVEFDLKQVKSMLNKGADPSFHLPKENYLNMEDYDLQPYSFLRLILFKLTDNELDLKKAKKLNDITDLLVGDPKNHDDARSYFLAYWHELSIEDYQKISELKTKDPLLYFIKLIRQKIIFPSLTTKVP